MKVGDRVRSRHGSEYIIRSITAGSGDDIPVAVLDSVDTVGNWSKWRVDLLRQHFTPSYQDRCPVCGGKCEWDESDTGYGVIRSLRHCINCEWSQQT